MKNKFKTIIILFFYTLSSFSQENKDISLQNLFKLNFINPGVGYDLAISNSTLFSTDVGISYSGAFDKITLIENNGFQYVIAPVVNMQYKYFYNRYKRKQKDKAIDFNSGNYFSLRIQGRGTSIAENLTRTDDIDFLIGPTWGFQRSFSKFYYLIDFGPTYYFDTIGNGGVFPINVQIKFGLNIIKE